MLHLNQRPILLNLYLLLSLPIANLQAQQKSPFITGSVSFSVKKGTVACDFVLSDLPNINNYVIRLNSGMNVHYFKDRKRGGGALYYDMDTRDSIGSDETKAYYLHENRGNPARYIPEELEVKYLGMYPVVADSADGYMGQDWRGNIAFNGYSLRAEGLQGDWYPVLYDMDKRKLYSEVRYNIHVSCEDCSVLFVNGCNPVRAKRADLSSDQPREMSIFCGKFEASEDHGIWLLNSGMPLADKQRLITTAATYQSYYEKRFGIQYKGSLTFAQTTPTADPRYWAFSFYSSPTTFNVGVGQYGMQSLFDKDHARRNNQVMAHELAHYYFGTLLKAEGVFGSIITEGFAEFLSLELTRNLGGDSIFRSRLKEKKLSLTYFSHYQPLSRVRTESDYGNREYYLYYYAPILFLAVEKEIGEGAMWTWLKAMVNSKADVADYSLLVATFRASMPDKSVADRIEAKYFNSTDALKSAIEELGIN